MNWVEWVLVGAAVLVAAVFSAVRLVRALSGRGGCDCGLVQNRRPESCSDCRACDAKKFPDAKSESDGKPAG